MVPWRGNPKRCWLQMLESHISPMPPTLGPSSQYLRYLGVCSFSIFLFHIVCQGSRVDKFGALFGLILVSVLPSWEVTQPQCTRQVGHMESCPPRFFRVGCSRLLQEGYNIIHSIIPLADFF